MVVGVPGTGIGGLFYLFMAVLMPVRELWRTLHGRGSSRAWRFISVQLAMISGIVGTMTLTQMGLRSACLWWIEHTDNPRLLHNLELMVRTSTGATAGIATFASIAMLCLVVAAVHVLRLCVGRKNTAHQPATLIG